MDEAVDDFAEPEKRQRKELDKCAETFKLIWKKFFVQSSKKKMQFWYFN